jgi:putative sterol carrier protein
MTGWLTEPWLEQVRSMEADLPSLSGMTGTIQFEITGGPDGDASCRWAVVDGRLSLGSVDETGPADLILTMGWAVGASIQRGELDPNVAFMQGRMKAAGSMEVLMALLPASRSTECRDLLARMASMTEF